MGLRVNTNVSSLTAQRQMNRLSRDRFRNMKQSSSLDRINTVDIDPAGLAISEKMKASIRSYGQAERNISDGTSLFQIAEGALNEISNMAIRLRELAITSANDTYGGEERGHMQLEFNQLKNEIQRIAETTRFNGKNLLDGKGTRYDFQVGISAQAGDRISFSSKEMDSTLNAFGITSIGVNSKEQARTSLGSLDRMLSEIGTRRSTLGGKSKKMEHAIGVTQTANHNMSESNSRIRDVDVAKSTAESAILNIREQAASSMLAQANTAPTKLAQILID